MPYDSKSMYVSVIRVCHHQRGYTHQPRWQRHLGCNCQITSRTNRKEVITEVLAKYPMPEYTIKAINNEGKAIKVDDNDTAEYNTWSIASELKIQMSLRQLEML